MFFLLLGLINAIDDLLCVLIENNQNVFDERLFYLFFIPLFSKIILKENIYKHHYLSLLISLIGGVFIIIPICLVFDIKKDIMPNILDFIKAINFPLFLVIAKYIVEKYFISPLKIILIVGIISIIINSIGYTIYRLIINDFSLFTDCFDFFQVENKIKIIIYFVLFFLFGIASDLTLFLSLFYFSPILIMVTYIVSPLLLWITEAIIISIPPKMEIIFNPIGYIITLISTLIYNELFIFDYCDLNKETKKFVNKRLDKEFHELKKNEEILFSDISESSLLSYND